MTVKIFGIKNCDTMKKTFKWLDDHGVAYEFHDYKKQGVDVSALQQAIKTHGWENVINKRGTTWRKLPDDIKNNMNESHAIKAATDNPSLIKRPLVLNDQQTYLGFNADDYKAAFK